MTGIAQKYLTKNKYPRSHEATALQCCSQGLTKFPGDTKINQEEALMAHWNDCIAMLSQKGLSFKLGKFPGMYFCPHYKEPWQARVSNVLYLFFMSYIHQGMIMNSYTNFVQCPHSLRESKGREPLQAAFDTSRPVG